MKNNQLITVNNFKFLKYFVFLLFFTFGCAGKKKSEEKAAQTAVNVPDFNADSAYFYVEKQVKFGPRIPGTSAHKQTGDFLVKKLKQFGAQVREEKFQAVTFDGQQLDLRNIIGQFSPALSKRILLASHWDTRPFADKDDKKPFPGANDGASGTGVLLEAARHFSEASPSVGVDVVFFDGEDWGETEDADTHPPEGWDSWWCLGSQYWAKHAKQTRYAAFYAILLDMVGASHAQFFREGESMNSAPSVVDKVWSHAHALGYADYFVKETQAAITDDHLFINRIAQIPAIDIVPYQPGIGYFGDYHHTQKDNMSIISKETLKAVGATILRVVYYEK